MALTIGERSEGSAGEEEERSGARVLKGAASLWVLRDLKEDGRTEDFGVGTKEKGSLRVGKDEPWTGEMVRAAIFRVYGAQKGNWSIS